MSSNKDIFDEPIKPYKDALKESGFSETLNYIAPTTNPKRQNRKQKIIWFNPPFSRSVKSNIDRTFLPLLSKHFPQNYTIHKIFNRNTVKISYSCLRNISSIISSHSHNSLPPKQQSLGCNCRIKNECPLNGECQTHHQLYIKQTWLTTQMMKKKFISDYLTALLKKGAGITIEILNIRSMKTVQN